MEDHKVIFWNSGQGAWTVLYLDKEKNSIISKKIKAIKTGVECPECKAILASHLKRHLERIHPGVEYVPPPRKPPTVAAPDSKEVKEAKAKMKAFCKTIPDDNVMEISVKDYIKLSDTSKSRLAAYRGECVQWPSRKVSLDPYVLGAWLGDGMQTGRSFATYAEDDPEILAYLVEWGKENDARFTLVKNTKCDYSISSIDHRGKKGYAPLRKHLLKYGVLVEKHIPIKYLVNDKKTRLAILAGLIDTDGNVSNDGSRITICQGMLHTRLAKDIVYLARSLGFRSDSTIRKTQWTWKGELKRGLAHGVNVSCDLIDDIPTVLPRKTCRPPNRKNVMNSGTVVVKKVEKGKYYGFETDGNNRFVLSDFTVTHGYDILSI